MPRADVTRDLRDRYLTWQLQRRIGALLRTPGDLLAALTGRQKDLTPPGRMTYAYGDHFEEIGQEFLQYFITLGGLQPDDRVLDVGCGIGRMALPLTRYLSSRGGYWGFDILADGIAWCRQNITSRFSNFHFEVADVQNGSYRPQGQASASAYRFPYADGAFDFAYACSVLTHMLPPDIDNYLAEISRVLRPGGACLVTFFVITPDALQRVQDGSAVFRFADSGTGYYSISRREPEKAVAYTEETLRRAYAACGLSIVEPLHYGTWSGLTSGLSGQDMIVARKSASSEIGAGQNARST